MATINQSAIKTRKIDSIILSVFGTPSILIRWQSVSLLLTVQEVGRSQVKMVKFVGTFHSTLEFGQVVIISGAIRKSAENFTLNLLSENASDIPFHMNFVFGENNQIIRNTKINGEFGAAETSPGMFIKAKNPLKSGEKD